ncbi:hypothetical protein C8R43DRAFT_952120 [Mycena crocata]|nr:hypothetical protein C8R43DRAFT_952120 [Mycena crocata]
MAGYIDSFTVPALRSLDVAEELLAFNPIHTISAFISRSGCTLEELHIAGEGSLAATSYRRAFASIPKLTFGWHMYIDERDSDSKNIVSSVESGSASLTHNLGLWSSSIEVIEPYFCDSGG